MELISPNEMRALEMNVEHFGLPLNSLMETAGASIVTHAKTQKSLKNASVDVYCGLGGNGGDGFVAARYFLLNNAKVTVFLLGTPKKITHPASVVNFALLEKIPAIRIEKIKDPKEMKPHNADFIIDALLGTGTGGPLREPISSAVECINRSQGYKIAVDIPTGINPESGDISKSGVVKANATITFHKNKPGLTVPEVKPYIGKLVVQSIGIPSVMENLTGPGDLFLVTPKRSRNAHKGDFGKVLVVGGSSSYTGAPALTGLAALRTGVDLLYVAAPKSVAPTIAEYSPDLIVRGLSTHILTLDDIPQISLLLEKTNAVVIGPGLDRDPITSKAILKILEKIKEVNLPVVIDADALHAIKPNTDLPQHSVLTPHFGEFKVLSGINVEKDLDKRIAQVQKLSKRMKSTILLKGAIDVVVDRDRIKINHSGNPGMTVGGTGDVLAGVIAAFLSQGFSVFKSATAGAYLSGTAGDIAARNYGVGLVASDVINCIPKVLKN
ncbi:MAG: NAD(P)H-hydrate dehydratase [Candidatus Ranarchaeia archaeon]|jgi:NAD(P)H-hydrate epimerase